MPSPALAALETAPAHAELADEGVTPRAAPAKAPAPSRSPAEDGGVRRGRRPLDSPPSRGLRAPPTISSAAVAAEAERCFGAIRRGAGRRARPELLLPSPSPSSLQTLQLEVCRRRDRSFNCGGGKTRAVALASPASPGAANPAQWSKGGQVIVGGGNTRLAKGCIDPKQPGLLPALAVSCPSYFPNPLLASTQATRHPAGNTWQQKM
mmetsp:Transcript_44494/g.141644  ORF Transcript_44494/g.141644 Transcript_44494/m.141644 type:complete len:208 (-) Transcript_44494:18-641(-)